MFQTSDDNNPIHNRTLNGLEGALFEAVGGKAIDAVRDLKLWSKFRSSPVGRKYFPGVKQDPKAAQKALEARGRLNNLLAKTYAEDQFGKTLNYTLKVQQDFALRALEDSRQPLNNLIEQAAQGDNGIVQYLQARTRALGAANLIDKTYNTVKFGGDPEEQVIDGLSWPGIQRQMDQLDKNIADAQQMSSDLDLRVEELSENLTQQSCSAVGGLLTSKTYKFVRSTPLVRQILRRLKLWLNLSAYQVKYLKDNKLLLVASPSQLVAASRD